MAMEHERRTLASISRAAIPLLSQVCQSPRDFLGWIDVAALNLLAAGGLPYAEDLDIPQMLDWLDDAARKVDFATRRHWYRFIESPATYNHSPAYFCCYFLLQVLQEDCGVRYNPARVRDRSFQDPKCFDPDFKDSRDLFIHGIIAGPGGTCSSMPVIYVAVGRRLGYPLKLVESRGHLFFRWDDPRGDRFGIPERVNIEGAGYGIATFPDKHYRTWPEPWTKADKAGGWYLKSLSPEKELAAFLCTRAECLIDNGRLGEAIQAYGWACSLVPNDLRYRSQYDKCRRDEQRQIAKIEAVIESQQRMRERLMTLPGSVRTAPVAPPHGNSCQCFHCKEARQAMPRQSPLGHQLGCGCAACQPQRYGIPGSQTPFGRPNLVNPFGRK